jgi:hypothetical protein
MKVWIIAAFGVCALGVMLYLAGTRLEKRLVSNLTKLELTTYDEFADKAASLSCFDIRLFALTNNISYLIENESLLAMPTRDFNYAAFRAHARVFNLYRSVSDNSKAEEHFLSASNYYYRIRGVAVTQTQLITNTAFSVKTSE